MKGSLTGELTFLALYVRKNVALLIVLSLGALIFVSTMATTGSFSYFLQKQSMYIAIDESSTDVILSQNYYRFGMSVVSPDFVCRTINSTDSVTNMTCLIITKVEVDTRINWENRGVATVVIVGLWTKQTVNFTASNSSFYLSPANFIVSQDFFNHYNITLQDNVYMNYTPNARGQWAVAGYARDLTPLTLSQLMKQLGIYDSLTFAGYDTLKLTMLEQYPFVVCHIEQISQLLVEERFPSLFFVKFAKEAFANPWDVEITVSNLKQIGQNLAVTVNNFTSQRLNREVQVVSIGNWPTSAVLQELSEFLSINRLTVLACGFTIAIVGWYFYSMLSQALIVAKGRELQLMRIRGASDKSLSRNLAIIIIIAGIVGTIFGLVLGYILVATLASSILGTFFSVEDFSATFSIYSLLVYSSFGLAASLLSQRKVFAQVNSIRPQDKYQKPYADTGKTLSAKIGLFIAFSLGAMKAASWIFGVQVPLAGQTTNPVTSAVLMLVRLVDRTVLDTLGPILLTYALVTIISMKPTVLSTAAYAMMRTLSSRLAMLSKRIMHEKSVKTLGGMIVFSLLIFNVVSAQMGYAGIDAAWTKLSIAFVGADIRINVREDVSTSMFQVLNNVSGVIGHTEILGVKIALGSPLAGTLAYVINSTEYTSLIDEIDPNLESMLRSATDMGIIASRFFHDVGVLDLGNTVKLEDRELRVMGFVDNLPGTLSIPPLLNFVVLDLKTVQDTNYTIVYGTVIVATEGRLPQDVADDITTRWSEHMNQSLTVATKSSAIAQFSHGIAISTIVKNVMSLLMAAGSINVIFAAAATTVMAYNEARDRRRLDVLLRTRGVTRRQLLSMALLGAFTLFLFALTIGLFAGYVLASGYTAYFSSAFPVNASPIVPYGLIVQLSAFLGIYLLLSLVPSVFVSTKVASAYVH